MKPFSLQVQETEAKMVGIINTSNLPAYALKTILQRFYQQLEDIEQKEINQYHQEQAKIEKSTKQKED